MAPHPSNIVLIGFMGTGKSTVGQILANRLHLQFVDMDPLLEKQAGKTITQIFAEDGEAHFRRLESELAQALARQAGLVIATGGGVVLNPENVRAFQEHGLVVCLTATAETILQRVAAQTHRPLLEQGDKQERILRLLESRRALYGALAHQVETSHLSAVEVAARIEQLFSTR